MKLLVCGGRDFNNSDFVWSTLRKVHDRNPVSILIHGGANGADKLAEQWADAEGIHYACVPALWSIHGKAAGPKRNRAMLLLQPDAVIAFPGGSGTADMVRAARSAGVRIVWEPKL